MRICVPDQILRFPLCLPWCRELTRKRIDRNSTSDLQESCRYLELYYSALIMGSMWWLEKVSPFNLIRAMSFVPQLDPPDSQMLYLKGASVSFLFEHSWVLSSGKSFRYVLQKKFRYKTRTLIG